MGIQIRYFLWFQNILSLFVGFLRVFFTRFKFWKVGGNNDDWQAVSNFVMFADDTYDKFNPPTS